MTAGAKVRLARDSQYPKLSQAKLAKLVGAPVTKAKIANWETERSDPDEHDLAQVAFALKIPIAWFYDQSNTPVPGITRRKNLGVGPAPPGSRPPARSSQKGFQPGVGRRFFPILGSAGAAAHPIEAGEFDEDVMEFSDDLTDDFRDQFVIRVMGDSAEPDIRHKDFVLVTKEPGFRLPGFFVVARTPTYEFVVKVLGVDAPQRLSLRSVNTKTEPIALEDGWEMVGFVVGWKREREPGSYIEAGEKTGLRPGFKD